MKARLGILGVVYVALLAAASSLMNMSALSPVIQLVAIVCTFFVVAGFDDVEVLEA